MMTATSLTGVSVLAATSLIPSSTHEYERGRYIFSQGDPAKYLFLLSRGESKLVVCSAEGKESTVQMVRSGEFLGDESIPSASGTYATSAVAAGSCTAIRFRRSDILQALLENPPFIAEFTRFLLSRGAQAQAEVVAQFFNSSEQRLARLLLMMAEDGLRTAPSAKLPHITQEALAEQVGTTRSRISFFMNRFRKLGLITYDHQICVFRSLAIVIEPGHTTQD